MMRDAWVADSLEDAARVYGPEVMDAYKYYWRDLDLNVVPFQYTWYDRRDRLAIAMGERGDPEARLALENITLKHRDQTMKQRARHALDRLAAASN